jgi:hypothetical protein
MRQRTGLRWLELAVQRHLRLLPQFDQVPLPRRLQADKWHVAAQNLQVSDRLRLLHLHVGAVGVFGSRDHRKDTRLKLARSDRMAATDPMAPLLLLASAAVLGAVLSRSWLLWLVLGGIAGYSLSGSV